MGSTIHITGIDGSLRWGYHLAGTLRSWTVRLADQQWTLSATVLHADAFRVSQRPLMFVAPIKGGAWRWSVTSLQIEGASLTAVLGPKES